MLKKQSFGGGKQPSLISLSISFLRAELWEITDSGENNKKKAIKRWKTGCADQEAESNAAGKGCRSGRESSAPPWTVVPRKDEQEATFLAQTCRDARAAAAGVFAERRTNKCELWRRCCDNKA